MGKPCQGNTEGMSHQHLLLSGRKSTSEEEFEEEGLNFGTKSFIRMHCGIALMKCSSTISDVANRTEQHDVGIILISDQAMAVGIHIGLRNISQILG